MSQLNANLFGKFSLSRDGHELHVLESPKLQELFCYLLLHRVTPHPREMLATLLWSESCTAQAKKYLRQALWHIQSALDEPCQCEQSRVLCVAPEWVRFNPDAELCLDVAIFDCACAKARGLAGRTLDAATACEINRAVELYRGDLLEGWYQDWCLCERERLQSLYLIMLDKLMSYCEAHQEYERGLDFGARSLRHDSARESTHRRLMRLYYHAGDRTAALRQYQRCAAALKAELDVKPAQRTATLYEQIRADNFESVPPMIGGSATSDAALADNELSANAASSTAATIPLPELLEHLRQLGKVVAKIQQQVQQGIQTVETVLRSRR